MNTQPGWWWTRLEEGARQPAGGAPLDHPGPGAKTGARLALDAVAILGRASPERGPPVAGGGAGTGRGRERAGSPALQASRRRAFLLLIAGILAARHGDYDRAVALDEESLALYRDLGHSKGTHGPLRELGVVAYYRGDYDRAVLLTEQALDRSAGVRQRFRLRSCRLRPGGRPARTGRSRTRQDVAGREPGLVAARGATGALSSTRSSTRSTGSGASSARWAKTRGPRTRTGRAWS